MPYKYIEDKQEWEENNKAKRNRQAKRRYYLKKEKERSRIIHSFENTLWTSSKPIGSNSSSFSSLLVGLVGRSQWNTAAPILLLNQKHTIDVFIILVYSYPLDS